MNIDENLISDNLVELLTNTIDMSSLFKDIFNKDATPATIKTIQYVYDDNIQKIVPTTVQVDNMSKIKSDLQESVVLPDESQILKNKTIDIEDGNTIANLTTGSFRNGALSNTIPDVTSSSDTVLPTQMAVAEALQEALAGNKIRVVTQDEYDTTVKDPGTLYFVKES